MRFVSEWSYDVAVDFRTPGWVWEQLQQTPDWVWKQLVGVCIAAAAWCARGWFDRRRERDKARSELAKDLTAWKRRLRSPNTPVLWTEMKAMKLWYDRNADALDTRPENTHFYETWLATQWLSFRTDPTTHGYWTPELLNRLYTDIDEMRV